MEAGRRRFVYYAFDLLHLDGLDTRSAPHSLGSTDGKCRIFPSHASANNSEAVALRDWLAREGFDDVFLDVDPDRGIAAGERWERALNEAATRCEAVLFVVSRAWLASGWCLKEFNLAHRLDKRLFGLLVEDLALAELPVNLTGTWQTVRLCGGEGSGAAFGGYSDATNNRAIIGAL